MTHNFYSWSTMVIKFSTLFLMGCIIQVTEYKYSFPVLKNSLHVKEHNLCPHALFSQAQSHIKPALWIVTTNSIHYIISHETISKHPAATFRTCKNLCLVGIFFNQSIPLGTACSKLHTKSYYSISCSSAVLLECIEGHKTICWLIYCAWYTTNTSLKLESLSFSLDLFE